MALEVRHSPLSSKRLHRGPYRKASPLAARRGSVVQNLANYCIYRRLLEHFPSGEERRLYIPTGLSSAQPSEVAHHLAAIADDVENRYREKFDDMCARIRCGVSNDAAYAAFSGVASELFGTGTNWGRIAALFAFARAFAVSLAEKGMREAVARVSRWLARFVETNLEEWIAHSGGWVSHNTFVLVSLTFLRRGLICSWESPTPCPH